MEDKYKVCNFMRCKLMHSFYGQMPFLSPLDLNISMFVLCFPWTSMPVVHDQIYSTPETMRSRYYCLDYSTKRAALGFWERSWQIMHHRLQFYRLRGNMMCSVLHRLCDVSTQLHLHCPTVIVKLRVTKWQ